MAETYSDEFLKNILTRARTIAVVGASANPQRPSHYVARFLAQRGYRVIPVNPGLAGQEMFGVTVQARLSEIQEPVGMVDIFRRSDAVPEIVDEALAALKGRPAIWMQIGVKHEGAAALARTLGCDVVMNRCPKVEYPRLFGDVHLDDIKPEELS